MVIPHRDDLLEEHGRLIAVWAVSEVALWQRGNEELANSRLHHWD